MGIDTAMLFSKGGAIPAASSSDGVLPFATGRLSDQFDVEKAIGYGESCTVYRAVQKGTQDVYACKSLEKSRLRGKADVERLRTEIKVLQNAVGLAKVVQLQGVFEDEHHVHVVMEYCRGGALSEDLDAHGGYSEEVAGQLFSQVVRGVCRLHESGIVHGNLAPDNILLLRRPKEGRLPPLRITGFSASMLAGVGGVRGAKDRRKARQGASFYMAPEVASGGPPGQEADFWSLGAVLWSLLDGGPPPQVGGQPPAGRRGQFEGPAWRAASADVKDLVRMLMSSDPSRRRGVPAVSLLQHPWLLRHQPPAATGRPRLLPGIVYSHLPVLLPLSPASSLPALSLPGGGGGGGCDSPSPRPWETNLAPPYSPASTWKGSAAYGAPSPGPSVASDSRLLRRSGSAPLGSTEWPPNFYRLRQSKSFSSRLPPLQPPRGSSGRTSEAAVAARSPASSRSAFQQRADRILAVLHRLDGGSSPEGRDPLRRGGPGAARRRQSPGGVEAAGKPRRTEHRTTDEEEKAAQAAPAPGTGDAFAGGPVLTPGGLRAQGWKPDSCDSEEDGGDARQRTLDRYFGSIEDGVAGGGGVGDGMADAAGQPPPGRFCGWLGGIGSSAQTPKTLKSPSSSRCDGLRNGLGDSPFPSTRVYV